MTDRGPIDYAALAAALLAQARTLIPAWLPGGRESEDEWHCASLDGGLGTGCVVTLTSGQWSDADTERRGGDLLSLYAAIKASQLQEIPMRDLHSNIHVKRAISPVVVTDNTPQVSQIIDRQGFESLEFVLNLGILADADATFVVLIEDGDDSGLSDASAVPDEGLLGTELQAGFRFDDDNEPRKIGYVNGKRYVRMTVTPSNNTGNAPMSALAILGHPALAATINPPA